MSILGVVVCGAPLAARTRDLAEHAHAAGWEVALTVTDAARGWLADDTPVQGSSFRKPGEPKQPRPDAVLVCPLTFNSASKWALGIADNRPLSLLCESLGAGIPIVAVPMVNETLWRHPGWLSHLKVLSDQGVVLIDPATGARGPGPVGSGTGELVTERFDPQLVVELLDELVRATS